MNPEGRVAIEMAREIFWNNYSAKARWFTSFLTLLNEVVVHSGSEKAIELTRLINTMTELPMEEAKVIFDQFIESLWIDGVEEN